MTGEEIQALRRKLECTPRELAEALGVSRQLVMMWESEERFPTKRHVEKMRALAEGQGVVPRLRGRHDAERSPMKVLSDPELWAIVRKLIAHPELRARVRAIADAYEDPAA